MTQPTLQIIDTAINDKSGRRIWFVTWRDRSGGDDITSLYLDEKYQERIAPRLKEMWTLQEIHDLEGANLASLTVTPSPPTDALLATRTARIGPTSSTP